MTPVRVLRVIARMNLGGPAIQVNVLAGGLDPDEFEQRILVGRVDQDEGDYVALRAPELPVTAIDGLGRRVRPGDDLRALRAIASEVRRFRPHIVHTHTAKAGALGRVAAWAGGAATVHTFHGHLLRGYFSAPVAAGVRGVESLLARRTTRLVAVGRRVRDELLAAGVGRPEQYHVVAPGLSLGAVPTRVEARRILGLPDGELVVAYVARLTEVKRPDRFVAVARRLGEHRHDIRFVVAGDGRLLDSVRRTGQRLGDRLRLLGWVADIETVYAAADLVLLTSDNEGMPVSLIEAAMAGVPAVTTAAGSAEEVVEHGVTGLVTSTDVDDIAAACARLLDDDELRARMGPAAAERAERLFSAPRLVSEMEALYRQVMAEAGVRDG